MKVLQVNSVYRSGSTGKITYDIHRELLSRGEGSVVCYGRGERVREPHVYKICGELYSKVNNLRSRLTGMMYGGCLLSTNRLIRIMEKEKPDIVHLQCINGYFVNVYRLIDWLKRHRIKTVLTLHAEFMYTANCSHAMECNRWRTGCGRCPRYRKETKSWFINATGRSWERMRQAFDGFDANLTVTSVSPWLAERAKKSGILKGKSHTVVLNGLDTAVFHEYSADDADKLKQQLGIAPDEKVIFHATPDFNDRPDHIKGGCYLLRLAERMQGERVRFVVAGSHPAGLKVPDNVILLGKIRDQALLARYYSMAALTLLTSRVETFSMVCAESLCCGTPVVGFRAGAPEQIAIPEYSEFAEPGDTDGLSDAVHRMLARCVRVPMACAERYSVGSMVGQYLRVYQMMKD